MESIISYFQMQSYPNKMLKTTTIIILTNRPPPPTYNKIIDKNIGWNDKWFFGYLEPSCEVLTCSSEIGEIILPFLASNFVDLGLGNFCIDWGTLDLFIFCIKYCTRVPSHFGMGLGLVGCSKTFNIWSPFWWLDCDPKWCHKRLLEEKKTKPIKW